MSLKDLLEHPGDPYASTGGRLVALSTPFGKRGWFHDAWHSTEAWQRVRITADQCPRISPEFLAEERRALGERWFRQEFMCSFEDTIDVVATLKKAASPLMSVPLGSVSFFRPRRFDRCVSLTSIPMSRSA